MSGRNSLPKLLIGDWLLLATALAVVVWLFAALWHSTPAGKLLVRAGNKVFATLSLNQNRTLEVPGPAGVSRIIIERGKVRFASSPCRNQYCVHQGWLAHAGQVAVCLPNQVSIELLGNEKAYDSINY